MSLPNEKEDPLMFSMHIRPEILKHIRETYPPGTKVELVSMNDQYREMPPGLTGVVTGVDDTGTVHVNWSNGSSLGALWGIDTIRRID